MIRGGANRLNDRRKSARRHVTAAFAPSLDEFDHLHRELVK
jgi:hypothetical protein